MDWFYLALLYPLLWAIVNLIDDNLVQDVYRTPHFGAIISGLFGALPAFSLFFVDNFPTQPLVIFFALASGFLLVAFYFLYFHSLGHEPPSVVVSLMNLTAVFIPLLAFVFLQESLSAVQYAGLGVILAGSVGISAIDVKKFHFSKALWFMGVASVLYSIGAIMLKYSYERSEFWPIYGLFALGMGLGAIFFMSVFKDGRTFWTDLKANKKKVIGFLVIAEIVNIAAEFVQNLAISRGPVSAVKVIEGVQPIYLIAIALLLYPFFPKQFREAAHGQITRKIFFMATMISGLYLINIAGAQ